LMQQIHGIRNVWDSGIVSNEGWKWHRDEEPITLDEVLVPSF